MTNREKHVCFNIAVTTFAGFLFVSLLWAHPWDYAMRAFTVLAFWGLGPVLFLIGRRDEAEQAGRIHHTASRTGLLAALGTLLLAAC